MSNAPNHQSTAAQRIDANTLRTYCAEIFEAGGSSAEEALAVSANLVMANLSGHDSHGVGMLPRYVDAILEGGLKPNTSVRVVLDIGTLLSLDGQHGFGQVVGEQAMQLGIERARLHGSCIMTLAHAHHLGRIGHWAEMAVAQGLVAIHFVNVISRPVVAPWGGTDGRFGTNPCCIGVPMEGRDPFVLDFATSKVAQGKMRVAHNEGRQVEPGNLIDAMGRPTTDPGVVVVPQTHTPGGNLFGALLPFGEHKGYGLAIACELLGGALSGGGTMHRTADSSRSVYNGMLTVLIDPKRLGTQNSFSEQALAFVDWLKKSPANPDMEAAAVLTPGEPERSLRLERQRDGIEIDAATWAEIQQSAVKLGLEL